MAVQLTLGVNRQVAAQPVENETDLLRRENERLSGQVEEMRRQLDTKVNAMVEERLNAILQPTIQRVVQETEERMRQQLINAFVRMIDHISDNEYQRRAWIEGEEADFDEAVCLFSNWKILF